MLLLSKLELCRAHTPRRCKCRERFFDWFVVITSRLDAYISRYGDFCANDNNDAPTTQPITLPLAHARGVNIQYEHPQVSHSAILVAQGKSKCNIKYCRPWTINMLVAIKVKLSMECLVRLNGTYHRKGSGRSPVWSNGRSTSAILIVKWCHF